MKNHFIKMIVAIVCTLLLTGCHKLEATTRIKPDSSGELQMGIGFSAEERTNMEKQGSNPQDFCNTAQQNPNIVITQEQRGDETWCMSVVKFKDLEELRGLYGEKEGIKINRLEISDGKFYYDIDVDTLSEDSSFSVLADIKWSLELPGAPIDHNADQVEGNTLTWIPTPQSGVIHLRAESEVPKRGFPYCGAAFLGMGAVLLYWNRRGRKYSL
jgi:hypothetical protein